MIIFEMNKNSIAFLDTGNINTEDSLWMLSAIVNHNLWNIDYKKMNKIDKIEMIKCFVKTGFKNQSKICLFISFKPDIIKLTRNV